MNIYYIYAYIRSKDSKTAKAGTPYYIGKGKDRRAYKKHEGIQKPSDSNFIIIMENNLSELGALALERRYIKWYGRKDINSGILHNRTDGGDCPPKITGPKSEETKMKMRGPRPNAKFRSGPLSEETKNKMRGPRGPRGPEAAYKAHETRRKNGNSAKGKSYKQKRG